MTLHCDECAGPQSMSAMMTLCVLQRPEIPQLCSCHAEELRKEAVKTQEDLPPLNRHMFTWTPPIPGFSGQQADRGKRRRGQS